MKGPRTYDQASLEIVLPMSIPAHLRENVREVFDLKSGDPGKGHGSELLRRVCGEADRESFVLMLKVDQDDKLVEWYSRFGFKPASTASPVVMIRPPEPVAIRQRKQLIAALVERI